MKELEKIIARTHCFMHQSLFRPNYIFNNNAYFSDFRAQIFPLIFFNVNSFLNQQALHFGVLNYEKQHKEGTCKVSGRSVVFSAFYADFCLCPKLVIITTLRGQTETSRTYCKHSRHLSVCGRYRKRSSAKSSAALSPSQLFPTGYAGV